MRKIIQISVFFIIFTSHSYISLSNQNIDTTHKANSNKTSYTPTKSPMGAVYRSLILPGWGQYYVGSYWKAPIFLAGAGTLGYLIIKNNIKFNDYANQYDKLLDKNTIEARILRNKREYFRDNRDMAAFYLLGVYILAATDAYVGAHLCDFSVDDNLTFNFLYERNNFYLFLKYQIK